MRQVPKDLCGPKFLESYLDCTLLHVCDAALNDYFSCFPQSSSFNYIFTLILVSAAYSHTLRWIEEKLGSLHERIFLCNLPIAFPLLRPQKCFTPLLLFPPPPPPLLPHNILGSTEKENSPPSPPPPPLGL